jgi:hypothetical protein
MPIQRKQLHTQTTTNALAALVGSTDAALLCNIRSSGYSVHKEELVAAFNKLFDTVCPLLEQIHAVNARRPITSTIGSMVCLYQDHYATEES